ncbi:DNA metabolism protein [Lithospermum erythrorhizon]|uniref:DNA metabolism protein n=1 Tax=Lithospermum erythrorhizon TaxID=34254 RepID=A0AAV3P7S1_LITER
MNFILRRTISSQKSLFLPLQSTITIQDFAPFSTTPKYTSTNHTLKSPKPKKLAQNWSKTVKKEAFSLGSTWPRPSEIPFQSKVMNFVNLIGKIEMPIKFHATPDGKNMASIFVVHKNAVFNGNFVNSLVIHVVFEGDLAHSVACHVKEGDCVYVSGKLSLDPLPFALSENQGKFYVVGDELKFVQGLEMKRSSFIEKGVENDNVGEEIFGKREVSVDENIKVNELNFVQGLEIKQSNFVEKGVENENVGEKLVGNREVSVDEDIMVNEHFKVNEDIKIKKEWEELLAKPNEWWVITSQDDGLKGAIEGFERRVDGKRVDLDSSTPVWVYKKLEELEFENKIEEKEIGVMKTEKKGSSNVGGIKKDGESVLDSWRDLVKNPMDWRDYREKKSSGSVKVKYPDFKHKTNGTALWLNTAPNWVLPGLEGLDVDAQVQVQKLTRAKGGKGKNEDSWRSLVENPDKWWDNRSRKTNVRAPDFRNKETGDALWLDSSPEWAFSQLPPLKNEQDVAAGNKKAYAA